MEQKQHEIVISLLAETLGYNNNHKERSKIELSEGMGKYIIPDLIKKLDNHIIELAEVQIIRELEKKIDPYSRIILDCKKTLYLLFSGKPQTSFDEIVILDYSRKTTHTLKALKLSQYIVEEE